jgi:hypothetical protein
MLIVPSFGAVNPSLVCYKTECLTDPKGDVCNGQKKRPLLLRLGFKGGFEGIPNLRA